MPDAGGGSFLTRKTIGGVPNWVLLAGGGVLIYVLVGRNKSAASTQAAAQPSPYPAQYSGGSTPVYIVGSGGLDTGSTGQTTGASSGVPSAGTPATDTAAPTYGYGSESVGGQNYTLLGIETAKGPQGYSGYNVSGGAPVFYLAPGQTTPTQGSGQAVPGAQVLVPSIYDPNISTTANHPYSGVPS